MTITLRVLLLLGALWMTTYVVRAVRRSRMKAESSFFWIFTVSLLVLMGAVPEIVFWAAGAIGIESPVNFVFLIVIMLLIIRLFSVDRKLEKAQHQLTQLTEQYAIDHIAGQKEEDLDR